MRAGMRAVMAASQSVVPHIAIQVRKSYGMAGAAASAVGGAGATKLRFGWPSGEWGAIPHRRGRRRRLPARNRIRRRPPTPSGENWKSA